MSIIVYMNENILEHTVLNRLFHAHFYIATFYPTENIFVWQPGLPTQLYYHK